MEVVSSNATKCPLISSSSLPFFCNIKDRYEHISGKVVYWQCRHFFDRSNSHLKIKQHEMSLGFQVLKINKHTCTNFQKECVIVLRWTLNETKRKNWQKKSLNLMKTNWTVMATVRQLNTAGYANDNPLLLTLFFPRLPDSNKSLQTSIDSTIPFPVLGWQIQIGNTLTCGRLSWID